MKTNYECPNCGYDFGPNESECKYCGTKNPNFVAPARRILESAKACITPQTNRNTYVNTSTYVKTSKKSRAACGILQIIFPGLGVGRFYSGHSNIGVAQILVTIFTCGFGSIWGVIDGIIILCNSEFKDANGDVMQ